MTTKRERILTEIHTRLSGNTGAGSRVYRGRTKLTDKDSFPLITILPQDSEIYQQVGDRTQIDWPITVQAIDAAGLDHPSDIMEVLLGQIKTYLLKGRQDTLDGHCISTKYLGDGGDEQDDDFYTSASVRISVRYVEWVGDPTK